MPSPYRTVNTLRLGYTNQYVSLTEGLTDVCSENKTEHKWAERPICNC